MTPMMKLEANVFVSKCSVTSKTFGIRIEKRGGDWVRTWAFPISDEAAKREGFDKVKVKGSFSADPGFPGCPHCGKQTFFVCGLCGKTTDQALNELQVTCKWCGTSGLVTARDTLDVTSGDY
jgi:DNA-directed RNA polymerase subunit RPC12/RpoP